MVQMAIFLNGTALGLTLNVKSVPNPRQNKRNQRLPTRVIVYFDIIDSREPNPLACPPVLAPHLQHHIMIHVMIPM